MHFEKKIVHILDTLGKYGTEEGWQPSKEAYSVESLSVLILCGYSAKELGHWIILKCGNFSQAV